MNLGRQTSVLVVVVLPRIVAVAVAVAELAAEAVPESCRVTELQR